ncbi:hypothetical protein [Actinokineospora pegani]|uniref:hypothetical protein n=1 Tax=Actinokineospora pegani TaxID=2654637 RepID=UPI0012E9F6A8|nr:hypothetical protein [Actinokineospora pegani]
MTGRPGARVFVSCAPGDRADVAGFVRGLPGPVHIGDGEVDAARARALDAAEVVVVWQPRNPPRFAAQWDLARAVLGARRRGADPRARVLVVSTEPTEPAELPPVPPEGALSAVLSRLSNTERRTDVGNAGPDEPDWDDLLLRPSRFVGRTRELWAVHRALEGDLLAERPRTGPTAVSVVGVGRTTFAERYRRLHSAAYPGGRVWTSFAGLRDDEALRAHWAAEVNRVARDWFGLDTSGLRHDLARAALAERLTERGEAVLWVVDDLDRATPDLVIDSPVVRALLLAPGDGPAVGLGPLSSAEADLLAAGGDGEADAALPVARCAGDPLLIAARAWRPGAADPADALSAVIRDRGDHARVVLSLAALLAPVPFPGELVADSVADVLGEGAPLLVARALDELACHALLHRTRGGQWRLPTAVAHAARRTLDTLLGDALAVRASLLVERALVSDTPGVRAHAEALAANRATPVDRRTALLRALATGHARRGDLAAAVAAGQRCLRVRWAAPDALAVARWAVADGCAETALRHTAALVRQAREDADQRLEYRARWLAATAHDSRGAYLLADHVFHHHPLVRAHGPRPLWASEAERAELDLGRATAARLRGDSRSAAALLRPLWSAVDADHPAGATGRWSAVAVEHARLTSDTALAERVVGVYGAAGLPTHPVAGQAAVAAVAGRVTAAWADRGPALGVAARHAAAEHARAAGTHGRDDPITLELAILHGQALHRCGRRAEALDRFTTTTGHAGAALGVDHPLALRARLWRAMARGALGDWAAVADDLRTLLPRQVAILGTGHPECALGRLHLGIGLAMTDRSREARPLLGAAEQALGRAPQPWRHWAAVARAGVAAATLPEPVVRVVGMAGVMGLAGLVGGWERRLRVRSSATAGRRSGRARGRRTWSAPDPRGPG